MRTQKRIDALKCSPRFLRLAPVLLLLSIAAANARAGSNAVRDAEDSRISVTAVAGDVDVTMAGNAVAVSPNTTVLLPARIVTGHDGNVGLTQAGTSINVTNDTDVEIPAEAVDGNLIARLIQHRGNVFYDVAPRDVGKLRVETPLLVAVIKGTQFNVAVQQDSTTISLFEGSLEIRTPDNSDVVQLNAGEIAIRSRVDGAIRVVGMDDERAVGPAAARPAVADAAAAETAPRDSGLTNEVAIVDMAMRSNAGDSSVVAKPMVGVAVDGRAIEVGLDAIVGADDGRVDVGLRAGVDAGGGSLDVGLDADVDLGGGAVDVGLDTGVDLGGAAVDVDLDTGLDLGGGTVDVGLDTTLDLGTEVLDAGVDAGLDLGGALDTGVGAGLDLGGVVDTSLDAGVTVDTSTLDVDLDAGLDLGGVLDLDLDQDLGAGTLDLGLDQGGDTAPAPTPRGGLGGLLGGLL